jgi:hypothetical protein
MIVTVFKNLFVDADTIGAVSSALPMHESNAVRVDFVVAGMTSITGNTSVSLEQSNDAENWRLAGSSAGAREDGYYVVPPQTGVCTRFVRLRCTLDDGTAVVAATAHFMRT